MMTVAVAEALIADGVNATKADIEEAVIANMQDWGRRYPDAGYGGRFRYWLVEDKPRPYNNYDFFTNGGKQMQPMACVANC